jgi:hypothetical protein
LGESLGIIYLTVADAECSGDLIRSLLASAVDATSSDAGVRVEHEEIWQSLFSLRRLGVRTLSADLLFAECDTRADYDHVLSVVLPAIRAKDSTDA